MNAAEPPSWTLTFPQPAKPRTMNHRGPWRAAWGATKTWRNTAAHHALTLGRSPSERRRPPCLVRVSFPTSTPNTRRDPHNWAPTVKAILDGMVDAGIWPDDNDQWVTVLDPRFHQVPRNHIGDVIVEMFPRAGALPE